MQNFDAAFAVHKYMRSHTGDFMTMGTGGAYVQYRKKLNTESWTEDNISWMDDALTHFIWTPYYLKDQGNEIHDNVIYQDNQSAVKLENNGRWSSSKWKRHIHIRYYFITDRIKDQEAYVEFFLSLEIIRDYLTKSLQGSHFNYLCNIIIGNHEYKIPSYN